jgi:hypothetical protein
LITLLRLLIARISFSELESRARKALYASSSNNFVSSGHSRNVAATSPTVAMLESIRDLAIQRTTMVPDNVQKHTKPRMGALKWKPHLSVSSPYSPMRQWSTTICRNSVASHVKSSQLPSKDHTQAGEQ